MRYNDDKNAKKTHKKSLKNSKICLYYIFLYSEHLTWHKHYCRIFPYFKKILSQTSFIF